MQILQDHTEQRGQIESNGREQKRLTERLEGRYFSTWNFSELEVWTLFHEVAGRGLALLSVARIRQANEERQKPPTQRNI